MAKKKKMKQNKGKLIIEGGYVRTRTPFTSSEVTRGTGTHKDKRKENNKRKCRSRIRANDYAGPTFLCLKLFIKSVYRYVAMYGF